MIIVKCLNEAQITIGGKQNLKAPILTGPLASSDEECSAH
jgi:hypothetical protein